MPKKEKEFAAGYASGSKHGSLIPGTSAENSACLWADNERKMESGIHAPEPLISAYWQGYKKAFSEQFPNT